MATLEIARPRNIVIIDSVWQSVREVVKPRKTALEIRRDIWETIKLSKETPGFIFRHQAAMDCPLQNTAVEFWINQSKNELFDHLHQRPEGWKVYRKFRKYNETTVGICQSPVEKLQEIFYDITSRAKQIRRKLKGGV